MLKSYNRHHSAVDLFLTREPHDYTTADVGGEWRGL